MFPQFSTTDSGGRMTWLEPGAEIGRLAPLVLRLAVAAAFWAIAAVVVFGGLGLVPNSAVGGIIGSPLAICAAVGSFILALGWTVGLHARAATAFGQRRVAGLLASAAVSGGVAVSAALLAALTFGPGTVRPFDLAAISSSPSIPPEFGALFGAGFALWAVVFGAMVPAAMAHARERQLEIRRLRVEGIAIAGVLGEIRFTGTWVYDQPHFVVGVDYELAGEPKRVTARMRTNPDRVPVIGSRVRVLADGQGNTLVELDPYEQPRFDPGSRYAPSEG